MHAWFRCQSSSCHCVLHACMMGCDFHVRSDNKYITAYCINWQDHDSSLLIAAPFTGSIISGDHLFSILHESWYKMCLSVAHEMALCYQGCTYWAYSLSPRQAWLILSDSISFPYIWQAWRCKDYGLGFCWQAADNVWINPLVGDVISDREKMGRGDSPSTYHKAASPLCLHM